MPSSESAALPIEGLLAALNVGIRYVAAGARAVLLIGAAKKKMVVV
jgi:hypothetical protein